MGVCLVYCLLLLSARKALPIKIQTVFLRPAQTPSSPTSFTRQTLQWKVNIVYLALPLLWVGAGGLVELKLCYTFMDQPISNYPLSNSVENRADRGVGKGHKSQQWMAIFWPSQCESFNPLTPSQVTTTTRSPTGPPSNRHSIFVHHPLRSLGSDEFTVLVFVAATSCAVGWRCAALPREGWLWVVIYPRHFLVMDP